MSVGNTATSRRGALSLYMLHLPLYAVSLQPSYHITQDFISRAYPRDDMIYNPEYAQIVKRISLSPLNEASKLLSNLVGRYNETCMGLEERRRNYSSREYFTRIPGKETTATQAMVTCKKLGMKLLELRTNKDVSRFLGQLEGELNQTPASIFYDQRTRSFVFASDNLPIKDNTAIKKTPDGYDVSTYDNWDSYRTYFGRYTFIGAQIFLEFVGASTKYDDFYCQQVKVKTIPGDTMCEANLRFIQDIVHTHQQYLEHLRDLLRKGYGEKSFLRKETRGKRTSPLFLGVVGGIFGAVTTELFTRISSDDEVSAAAAETEKVLNSLGERTNALDINQKRLHTLINQIQIRLNQELGVVTHTTDLSNIHIQINSVLIHVNDHLGYLYRLLAGGDTDSGINLAMSEEERRVVLERSTNRSGDIQISAGKPIKHKFQFIAPETLCVIMEVPIRPLMTSVAAVESISFPNIQNGTLWSAYPRRSHFIQFSGSYFVEVGSEAFQSCKRQGVCSGMLPLQHADDTVECNVAQYFRETKSLCLHEKLGAQRFIIQAGTNLAYALLKPLALKIECVENGKDAIMNLKGRGVIEVPDGCKAVTSKAVLNKFKPARFVFEHNTSLPGSNPLSPPTSVMANRSLLEVDLIKTNQKTNINQERRKTNMKFVISGTVIGGAIIVLLVIIIIRLLFALRASKIQRPVDL